MIAEPAATREVRQQYTDGQHTQQRDKANQANRDVLLGARQQCRVAFRPRARSDHGRAQAPCHWLRELCQRPYRGDPDGARANEAYLVTPGVVGQGSERSVGEVRGSG